MTLVTPEMIRKALGAWYGSEDPGPHTEPWQLHLMRSALEDALEELDPRIKALEAALQQIKSATAYTNCARCLEMNIIARAALVARKGEEE